MIPVTTFAGRSVAVFGLGRSGIATCDALRIGGAEVYAWDDNVTAREAASASGVALTELTAVDWAAFDALVLSPGVPLTHPEPHWTVSRARDVNIEVIGDIELFVRQRAGLAPQAPFVAITGTNGKSTTTALVAHILRSAGADAQMGGNIGVPILALEPPAPRRIYAVEMSSYQIDLTPSLAPTIGVLLNLSPDHIDRHGSFENYRSVKARLLEHAVETVIGCDDDACRELDRLFRRRGSKHTAVSGFAIDDGYGVEDGWVVKTTAGRDGPDRVADITGVISLRGRHNAQNAAAASSIAFALGVSKSDIAAALRTFPGLEHRMEQVAQLGRVIFINDSKATNADSASNALASFDRDIFWIAGGLAKEGGITSLKDYFPRVAKVYLIGESASDFAHQLAGRIAYESCGELECAVTRAASDAAQSTGPEPVVLLSPACASFDQFPSFEARGGAFKDLVRRLPGARMREDLES
ncbi:MAG: UDP-N-acetylmuramoyl-L-alanine--D-glutamate ligase [Hyphomicrobiaceae bacterium]